MGQGHFRNIPREVRHLAGPVAEARTEPMRDVVSPGAANPVAHAAHQLQQGHVRQRAPVASAREHVAIDAWQGRENLQRRIRQRHPVLAVGLHPRRRNGPGRALQVDLRPLRLQDLPGAAGCQDEELEGERRHAVVG